MTPNRMYHSIRLFLLRSPRKRAEYLKKHDILGHIGENCYWGPWLLPLYPKMIRIHNNVHVHKTAKLVPHDMLNRFLASCDEKADFGHGEKLGCIEMMDNVYIAMNCIVMPNVRINRNCIISAGSIVTSDIPENTIATGIPAKPNGRFDMFMALRKMNKSNTVKFKNQELPDEIAEAEWKKFLERHDGQ